MPRITGLDGLRALAVSMVILSHLQGTKGFPLPAGPVNFGSLGVRIFFVLSGYLITSLLNKEIISTDTIDLKVFYYRRGMRLFPACLALITFVALLSAKGIVYLGNHEILSALTYTMNFNESRSWNLGHLWSLAVEEQFYVIWPVVIVLLGVRRSTNVLYAMLIVAPLCRIMSPYTGVTFNFLVHVDSLATGCLLAMVNTDKFRKLTDSRWFLSVPVTGLIASQIPYTKLQWLIGIPLTNLCIALIIVRIITNSKDFTSLVMNHRYVKFIGTISYSLYLWQQPFLNRHPASWFCMFPQNLIMGILFAVVSYYLIERPFMELRDNMQINRRRIITDQVNA